MYKSLILPAAREDIREAATWYNKQRAGLGRRFTKEVRDRVHYIRQYPTAFNVRYDDIRTAVLNTFPFMIHYAIDDRSKTIIISAVLHTSRNPELWKNR